jgi:hypothetical protein
MENSFSWLSSFDPTENNYQVEDTKCTTCGGKDFEHHREGDFRDVIYIEVCKNCKSKK